MARTDKAGEGPPRHGGRAPGFRLRAAPDQFVELDDFRGRPNTATVAKNTSIRALTLLGSALIGGCVTEPVVWTKPGVDEGDVAADVSHCRDLVDDEGWRVSWEATWPPRFYDPLFMPPYYVWPRPFWYDFPLSLEREQALFEFCMHSKGYRLQALLE